MFNASRLEVARKRRRIKKGELAQAIGVDLRNITAYEREEYEPSPETLGRMAKILDVSPEWFSSEDLYQALPSTVSFRSQSRMSAKNRDAALASGAIAFLLNDFIEKHFKLPSPDLPDMREEDPEIAAITLRQHWGLGEMPIKNMVHLLEAKGIRVFSLAEDTAEVDAFSLWREHNPFVFLNTLKSSERSRFDAAHELGHLVLHRHGEPKGKEVESQANRFASAFLMPKGSILAKTPPMPSLDALIKLKKIWIVSVAALEYRLNSLGLLTAWHHRTLCIEIGQRGYKTNEPHEAPREMSLIFPKVFKMLREDGVRKSDIASSLCLSNIEDIDKLVFGLILTGIRGQASIKNTSSKKPSLRIV